MEGGKETEEAEDRIEATVKRIEEEMKGYRRRRRRKTEGGGKEEEEEVQDRACRSNGGKRIEERDRRSKDVSAG